MEKVLPVNTYDDFAEGPSGCLIQLSPERIEEIKALAGKVAELGVYTIQDFDNSIYWLTRDKEGLRTDCSMIVIEKECVRWKGYLKNTGIEFGTESILLKSLEES